MKKNIQNRGFIATAVLYSLVILIVLSMFIILRNFQTIRNVSRENEVGIKGELFYYEVSYDGNGSTGGVMEPDKIPSGRAFALSKCKYSKEGYAFIGWTRRAEKNCDFGLDGGIKNCYRDQEEVMDLAPTGRKITLYAQWGVKRYLVTFDPNGGNLSDDLKTKQVLTNSTYGNLPIPSREGYAFDGWYTEKEGGTSVQSSSQIVVEADHILYAHWKKKRYTVLLDANGGVVSPSKLELEHGTKTYGTLPTPIQKGYEFVGWYTDRIGGSEIRATTVFNNRNSTLYARWKEIKLVDLIVQDTENCKTYNDGIDTFLVGKCPKNYVWYSGKLWRVYAIHNDTKDVKMITSNAITTISFNTKDNTNFAGSFAETWLNGEFLATLHDSSKYLVSNSAWDADTEEQYKNNVFEIGGVQVKGRPAGLSRSYSTVGLPNLYDVSRTRDSFSSGNKEWSTLTPYGEHIRVVDDYATEPGLIGGIYPENLHNLRPTVWLKAGISSVTGTGEKTNPYRLAGDQQATVNGSTLLSTRYSGDFVRFNNSIYRIVGVEGGLTKITAVDAVSSLGSQQFHSSSTSVNFSNANIRTQLQNYYTSISSSWKNLIQPNTNWYFGTLPPGGNYRSTIDSSKVVQANIGLPRLGEMFTSSISRSDVNREAYFWTLTPYSGPVAISSAHYYVNNRFAGYATPTNSYTIRPSLYLKSTVKIASTNTGDGTYEHPYSIE